MLSRILGGPCKENKKLTTATKAGLNRTAADCSLAETNWHELGGGRSKGAARQESECRNSCREVDLFQNEKSDGLSRSDSDYLPVHEHEQMQTGAWWPERSMV